VGLALPVGWQSKGDDMDADSPVDIPAKPAIVADKMLVESLRIDYQADDVWAASATVVYYAEDAAGNKTFAVGADGARVRKSMRVPDVFARAAKIPALGKAISAIQDAVMAMLANQPKPPAALPESKGIASDDITLEKEDEKPARAKPKAKPRK
jgi:hypothetical protein